MASSVGIDLGNIFLNTAMGSFHRHVHIKLSKSTAQQDFQFFADVGTPDKVQRYLHSILETLGAQADPTAFRAITADLFAGRNIEILPGHRICTFTGNPNFRMPNPNDHIYQVPDTSVFRNAFIHPRDELIPVLDRIFPAPATPVDPAAPPPPPEKNWFDHAQTTSLPIPYPKFYPDANNWSKASSRWTQISYSILKKADDFSITINESTSKYTGVLSLVIRATLVALGIIGFGLSWAVGHLTYVPFRAIKPAEDAMLNLGTITLYINMQPRVFNNVEIYFDSEKEPTPTQKNAIREHYSAYLQALINEINFHPDETTRLRFQAVFIAGRVPIAVRGYGLRFDSETAPFMVADQDAFIRKYDGELRMRKEAIDRSFEEPATPPPAPNWFDDALNEPIPIPRPAVPVLGDGAFKSSSLKVSQAANDVFKTFDEWAVAFDKATSKYLGAGSLVGRVILDLTGLVIGFGIVGLLGHLTYVPIAGLMKRDVV